MEDDVGAKLQRALEVRRGERIVDDEQRAAAMRDVSHGGDVSQAHERIARRLEQDCTGGLRHRVGHALRIAGIDVAERQPHVLQDLVEQAERAAIDVFRADDVVTGAEQLHDRVEAPHAARKGESMTTIFQRCDIPLESLAGGILASRVLVPLVLSQTLLDVGRREVDGRHDGARQRFGSLSCVDGAGSETRGQVLVKNARHTDTLSLRGVRKITAHPECRN
jgi:hypothetical protein